MKKTPRPPNKTHLTAWELKQILHYDPGTGIFWWKVAKSNCVKAGEMAGSLMDTGYIVILIDRSKYYAHRLAWLYMTGHWPPDEDFIDHANCERADNRFVNLRLVSKRKNQFNRLGHYNRLIGSKGWSKIKTRTGIVRYRARINFNHKYINLGNFDTPEEAHAAYCKKGRELFGEYFRAD